jgi:hypothetical protein
MPELDFSQLPALPQSATIRSLATLLWQDARVVALWVGGSLASGAGDRWSDVDFRVAVPPEDFAPWQALPFDALFAQAPVVGSGKLSFGTDAVLHHLVLANGEILDFFVQTTTRTPTQEPLLVLGCRDAAFARVLAAQNGVPGIEMQPVNGEAVRELLVSFWISSHKHRKVLARGLDLMAPLGLQHEQSKLLRLWYIEASGMDCGDMRRQTIHSLTQVIRTIEQARGASALEVIGAPARNRQELIQTIEANRQVVSSSLGPCLAERYGFAYPAALEATTRQGWQVFLDSIANPHPSGD